jgi:hypothetical protein
MVVSREFVLSNTAAPSSSPQKLNRNESCNAGRSGGDYSGPILSNCDIPYVGSELKEVFCAQVIRISCLHIPLVLSLLEQSLSRRKRKFFSDSKNNSNFIQMPGICRTNTLVQIFAHLTSDSSIDLYTSSYLGTLVPFDSESSWPSLQRYVPSCSSCISQGRCTPNLVSASRISQFGSTMI